MLGSVVYYLFLAAVLCFALRAFVPRRRRNRRLSGTPMRYARQGTTLRRGTTGSAGDRELRRATRAGLGTRLELGTNGANMWRRHAGTTTLTMPPPGHRLPSLSGDSPTPDVGAASSTRPYGDYTDLSPAWRNRLESHDRDAA